MVRALKREAESVRNVNWNVEIASLLNLEFGPPWSL